MGDYRNCLDCITMTEQEELWNELESATSKKKKKQQEKERPDKCSFCNKKTKRLTHVEVGGINIYLCKSCMDVLQYTRKKLGNGR